MPNYRLTHDAKDLLKESGRNFGEIFADEALNSIFDAARRTHRGVSREDMELLIAEINALKLTTIGDQLIVLDAKVHCAKVVSNQPDGANPVTTQDQPATAAAETPAILDIPFRRNPYFIGRERDLATMRKSLTSPDSRLFAISGLGGIGKTQLAVEYAFRNRDLYAQVFWTAADTEGSLLDGYLQIARSLELQVDYSRPNDAIPVLKNWMARERQWLLILDNADHPRILDRFIPSSPSGHIVITSRAASFDSLGAILPLRLDQFTLEESLHFLQVRTNRKSLISEEAFAANQLSRELGGLALALEQAAAFISATSVSFDRYLQQYKSTGLELLERSTPELGNYSATVATTWLMNFREVAQASIASMELMRTAAFLRDPDNDPSLSIPFSYLTDNPEVLDDELAPNLKAKLLASQDRILTLSDLLRPLSRYSLVYIDNPEVSFSIHPLVLEVTTSLTTI